MRLNPSTHTLSFVKGCPESLTVCQAMCCRGWDIALADEEYRSGLYQASAFCSRDKKECRTLRGYCYNRRFRLKKRSDGACCYLNNKNRCTIYNSRPILCRNFSCRQGWHLAPRRLEENVGCGSVTKRPFIKDPQNNSILLKNQLITLEALAGGRKSKQLMLRFRDIRFCSPQEFPVSPMPGLTLSNLKYILNLFSRPCNLGKAFAFYNEKYPKMVGRVEFKRFIHASVECGLLVAVKNANNVSRSVR